MKRLVLLLLLVASSAIFFVTQTGLQYSSFDLASGCYVPRGRDSTALSNAITEITWNACIRISPSHGGRTSGDVSILADLTIPTRFALDIPRGPRFSVGGGVTLTLPCDKIRAGRYPIFTGAGTITCSNVGAFYPEWAGVTMDGTTDDQASWTRAVAALATAGGTLDVGCGTSVTSSASPLITLTDADFIHIRGSGISCTTLKQNGAGDGVNLLGTSEIVGVQVSDLTIEGNNAGANGLKITNSKLTRVQNVNVNGFLAHGVFVTGTNNVKPIFRDMQITAGSGGDDTKNLLYCDGTNILTLENIYFNTGCDGGPPCTSRKQVALKTANTCSPSYRLMNAYDGADTGAESAGEVTSVNEYLDVSSPNGLALTTTIKHTTNNQLVVINAQGATLCNATTGAYGNMDVSAVTTRNAVTVMNNSMEGSVRPAMGGVNNNAVLPPDVLLSGDVSDYNPTDCAWAYGVWMVDPGGASRTINSITNGWDGRQLKIINKAAAGSEQTLTFPDNGTGTAVNKFATDGGIPIVVRPGESIVLNYDGDASRWRPEVTVGSARLRSLAFSSLGAVQDGVIHLCPDCVVTSGADNTCASGAGVALAVRLNSVWRCFALQN